MLTLVLSQVQIGGFVIGVVSLDLDSVISIAVCRHRVGWNLIKTFDPESDPFRIDPDVFDPVSRLYPTRSLNFGGHSYLDMSSKLCLAA